VSFDKSIKFAVYYRKSHVAAVEPDGSQIINNTNFSGAPLSPKIALKEINHREITLQ
jgi:hypothetical protein